MFNTKHTIEYGYHDVVVYNTEAKSYYNDGFLYREISDAETFDSIEEAKEAIRTRKYGRFAKAADMCVSVKLYIDNERN